MPQYFSYPDGTIKRENDDGSLTFFDPSTQNEDAKRFREERPNVTIIPPPVPSVKKPDIAERVGQLLVNKGLLTQGELDGATKETATIDQRDIP